MPLSPIVLTNAALSAINTILGSGGTLAFSKVMAGNGFATGADVPANFVELKSPVMEANPTSINIATLYQTTIRADLNSANAPYAFKINELGVFYSLNGGTDFLFGYSSTSADDGDTLSPPVSGASAIIKDYVLPVVYARDVPVGTTVTFTPTVDLHSVRHLSSGVDPIPNATSNIGGLCPRTPGDTTRVLLGGPTASFGTLPPHAPSHLDNGSDPLPVATTTRTGALTKLSGDANSYLNGVGAWAAGVAPGIVLDFAGGTAPVGFLICDGQSYSTTNYAALFAVIGYTYGGSGASFQVPDCRGRTTVGAGIGAGLTTRPLASKFGEETHTLSTAEIPNHNHPLSDPGHAHSVADGGHSHGVSQSPHAHGVSDPTHAHSVLDNGHNHLAFFSTNSDGGIPPQAGRDSIPPYGSAGAHSDYGVVYGTTNVWWLDAYTSTSRTGIGIYGAATGIGIFGANANIGINGSGAGIGIYGSGTGISIAATGGGAAHNNCQPSIALNKVIKY